MAGVDDVLKGAVITGAVVGIGAVVLAPMIFPIVANISRPLAKSTIKSGMIIFKNGRETIAELVEVFDDLVAEARAELEVAAAATADSESSTAQKQAPPETAAT